MVLIFYGLEHPPVHLLEPFEHLRDQLVVHPRLLQVQVAILELHQLAIVEGVRSGVNLSGLLV